MPRRPLLPNHPRRENPEHEVRKALKTDFAHKGKLFLQFFSKLDMLFTGSKKKRYLETSETIIDADSISM